jgi:osmotically-inducible protein OsmY
VDLNVAVQARALFMADPTLSQRQLFVSSNRGAVSLSGSVIGPEESRKAEGLVVGITGVRSVANDIIVTLPPRGLSHGL